MKTIEEHILLEYIDGLLSNEENAQVESWLAESPENMALLEQLFFTVEVTKRLHVMESVDTEKSLLQFKENIIKQNKKVSWLRKWKMLQQIAAILIFSVLVLSAFLLLQKNPEMMVCTVKVRTNPGVISDFNLPDGSKVWLNAGSTLIYPSEFSSETRTIELTGEGYFEIAQDLQKPFIIQVDPSYSVEVTGTSFNISAYPEDQTIETTLVEGTIKLHTFSLAGKEFIQELSANQKAEFKKTSHKLEISTTNPELDTSWKDGQIRFRRAPMGKVLNTLSRHFNVSFDVKDESIYNSVINLTFGDETVAQVMDYLSVASGISYKITKPTEGGQTIGKPVIQIRKQDHTQR